MCNVDSSVAKDTLALLLTRRSCLQYSLRLKRDGFSSWDRRGLFGQCGGDVDILPGILICGSSAEHDPGGDREVMSWHGMNTVRCDGYSSSTSLSSYEKA